MGRRKGGMNLAKLQAEAEAAMARSKALIESGQAFAGTKPRRILGGPGKAGCGGANPAGYRENRRAGARQARS